MHQVGFIKFNILKIIILITLVLTNRNRDLRIVKKSLDSIQKQTNQNFQWFLVDYGSEKNYLVELQKLIVHYPKLKIILCPVSGQLWNKCRAINIVVKTCDTPYFLAGDIDLIYHPDFIAKATILANAKQVHFFQYGFLAKTESILKKEFDEYVLDFKGDQEVTGTTMFPTKFLKKINGYDEFYHGWGAEDTDIHIRMKKIGLSVNFYDSEILIKHQWHPKAYRTRFSTYPFHSNLERINHFYMNLTDQTNRVIVNQNNEWGKKVESFDYEKLSKPPQFSIRINNSIFQVNALLAQFKNYKNETVFVEIYSSKTSIRMKNILKKFLGKKHQNFITTDEINNLVLEEIIKNYRNCPYQYSYNRNTHTIKFNIYFN